MHQAEKKGKTATCSVYWLSLCNHENKGIKLQKYFERRMGDHSVRSKMWRGCHMLLQEYPMKTIIPFDKPWRAQL